MRGIQADIRGDELGDEIAIFHRFFTDFYIIPKSMDTKNPLF